MDKDRKIAESLIEIIRLFNNDYPADKTNSWKNHKERTTLYCICNVFKLNGLVDKFNFTEETVTIGNTIYQGKKFIH